MEGAKETAENIVQEGQNIAQNGIEMASNMSNYIAANQGAITEGATNVGNNVINTASTTAKQAGALGATLGTAALNTGQTVGTAALNTGQTVGNNVVNAGRTAGNNAVNAGKIAGNAAINAGQTLGTQAEETGTMLAHNAAIAKDDVKEAATTAGKVGAVVGATMSTKISEQSHVVLGQALAAVKDINVEEFEFPVNIKIPDIDFTSVTNVIDDGTDKVMDFVATPAVQNAMGEAVDLCSKVTQYIPFDLAKFEIVRDFYQILGILVECISFPVVFEEFFGTIAKIMSLAVSDLLKYAISISNLAWWWIITVIAILALVMVLNFFKQDVGKDISKVGLNVEVKARKFDWKKQNQKDGGSRYRKVKYLLFLMTSIYAPVSRNAIQMIWCADKYAYARFKCETFHFDNATGTNIADAEPIFGYLSKGNTLCLEVRQQLLPSLPNKGGLPEGTILETSHERMTITKSAAFTTTFGGNTVETLGGSCWNNEGHLIHVLLSIIVVIMITIRFPRQMSRVIVAFRPQPIEPDDPKHPYKDPPQLGTPNYNEEVRKQMELCTKPVWFNDEGGVEEFTSAVYAREIARLGDNPYVYLYEMYEEKWAHFKTYVMWFKFIQIIPAVTLTAWFFDNLMTEDSHVRSIIQASFAIFILVFYLYFACKERPFINAFNDFLDQTCRMVLLFCPIITIVAYASENPKGRVWGDLLNTVVGIHLVFLVISTVFSGHSAATRIKKLTGRLDFTIGSVKYKGKVGTLPKWDMAMERKRRLWKPFWDHLFHDDVKLSTVKKEKDPKTEKEKDVRLPIVKPFVDGPLMKRPQDRLDEMIEKLHTRGFKAWESNLLPMTPQETQLRYQVQTQLEGIDVYCDDKWTSVPGLSSILDQQYLHAKKKRQVSDVVNVRQSNWCTIVVSPFPFTVNIYWENCNVVGELVSWGLTKSRIQELLHKNMRDPDIIWQRQVRLAFRALAKSQQFTGTSALMLCPMEKLSSNGTMMRYSKCSVEWPEVSNLATLDADNKNLKRDIELAGQPRFLYQDGTDANSGTATAPDRYFTLDELGIGKNYNKSNRLLNMLGWVPNGNQNTNVVRKCMQDYLEFISEKRNENLKPRVLDQYSLSWGFWYFVYNNDMLSRIDLERYLQSGAEQNPLVRNILTRKKKDLNLLYSMLNFYNSSPLCAYWFSFWYDVWMHNQDLPKIKEAEKLLDFLTPDAICYKPMGMITLRKVLQKYGNPLGSKQEQYLKALFTRLKECALENKVYQLPLVSYQAPFQIKYLITNRAVNKVMDAYLLSDKYNQGEEFDDQKPRMPPIATAANIRGDLEKAMKLGMNAAQQSINAHQLQINQAKMQEQQRQAIQAQQMLQVQQARTEQLKRQQEHQEKMIKEQQRLAAERKKQQEEQQKRMQEMYKKQQEEQRRAQEEQRRAQEEQQKRMQEMYKQQQERQRQAYGGYGQQPAPQQFMQQQQQQQQGGDVMAVQVPYGMGPGQMIQIQTPKGMMQVQIPQGVGPGMTFHVRV